MANIRNIKKDINHVLGEIIEMALVWEKSNPRADKTLSAAIIDDAIIAFDEFRKRIYQKDVADKKVHFRSIQDELAKKGTALIVRVNAL